MTGSNGAHVEVAVRMGDPLTVTNEEPCHTAGREFRSSVVREMLNALGIKTCRTCGRFTGLAVPRSRWRERP